MKSSRRRAIRKSPISSQWVTMSCPLIYLSNSEVTHICLYLEKEIEKLEVKAGSLRFGTAFDAFLGTGNIPFSADLGLGQTTGKFLQIQINSSNELKTTLFLQVSASSHKTSIVCGTCPTSEPFSEEPLS